LIDSTGIKAKGEGEGNTRKHGGPKRQIWRKIPIGIDEETFHVWAGEVVTSNVGAPILSDFLDQILSEQKLGAVTADTAYDPRKCHEAVAARHAHAVIPPRKNAKPWKLTITGATARNKTVKTQRCLGRTVWRRWCGYHRQSRAETKMHL
jgi:hypothetical protein